MEQKNLNDSKRIDEVEKHYLPIEKIESATSSLFFVNIILSLLLLLLPKDLISGLYEILQIIYVLCVVSFSLLSLWNKHYLTPRAEEKRRKQLLSDSFGITLSIDKTQSYYNNDVRDPILRLGANVMENSFFSKEISARMLKRRRMVTVTYFIFWLMLLLNRSGSLHLIILITQIVFSGEVLYKWIRLEALQVSFERVFENLYQLFLHRPEKDSPSQIASILAEFSSYEWDLAPKNCTTCN